MNNQVDLIRYLELIFNQSLREVRVMNFSLYIDDNKIRMSQLNLVDLAGSEGASRTET